MSEYKDLQKEAKSMQLKYIGVSETNLKRSIQEAKAENPEKPVVETPTQSAVKPSKSKIKANVAVVRNITKQEVRRYTEEIHGNKFAELAKEFANGREYSVELIEAKASVVCPNCGHVLE